MNHVGHLQERAYRLAAIVKRMASADGVDFPDLTDAQVDHYAALAAAELGPV